MQWPVTACSKLRVDYNEHQVKLTVSIEAAGVAGAAGKTRKNRKKRNDSESFDCVGGLLARWIDGLVGLGLELGPFGGWYVVVSDICRHILRLRPGIGLTYVAVTCKIVIIPAVATRTSTSAMHCNKLNWNFKEGEIAFDSFVCVCILWQVSYGLSVVKRVYLCHLFSTLAQLICTDCTFCVSDNRTSLGLLLVLVFD